MKSKRFKIDLPKFSNLLTFFEKLCYHGAEGKMSGRRIGGTVVAAGTKPRDTFVSLRFCPMLTTACGKDLVAVQCRYEWTV